MNLQWSRIAVFWPVLTAASASHAVDCHLACVSQKGDAQCHLNSPSGPVPAIGRNAFKSVADCQLLTVGKQSGDGRVELRYHHKARWFSPSEGVNEGPLQKVFDKYPPDSCSVPSPRCIQSRMNGMVASIGGHGIDDKASKPGGEGNPCLIGLPCGVVLPPSEVWSFRLADAGVSGTWTVKLARGVPPPGLPAEVSTYVDRGVARVAGAWFAPGTQYVYRFVDDAGRVSSTGEFSVASRATHETLRKLMQRRVAQGLPEGMAWPDTLVANNHEWDALQLSLIPQESR